MDIKQSIDAKRKKRMAELKRIHDCFQVVMNTEAGREVITYLVCESRVFANAMRTNATLKKAYGVGPEYLLAQTDFGRNILSFLTEEQVAELIRKTQQKEEKNE